jgi:hypothetical protein
MRKIIIRRYFVLLIVLLSICKEPSAQYSEFNSSNIYSKLQGLNVFGSVLYIGATPADKNLPLLTYLSKEKHYRTGFLSFTRGESLKNKYGFEQGIETGLIHVEEQSIENKIDGVENFYTRAYDAGSPINEKEVFANWDTGKILSDVVWIIRTFQPDIIITGFSPDNITANGQGFVSAIIAKKAFVLAADSAAFPEQIKYGASCWQAKRLLWNDTAKFNSNIPILNTNIYNSATGLSIGDDVAFTKQYQKSMFSLKDTEAIQFNNAFYFVEGDSDFANLMDGIDTSWHRINDSASASFQLRIDSIINNYNFLQPELSVKDLISIYKILSGLHANNIWKNKKLQDIQDVIFLCSGIKAQAYSNQQYAVTGDTLNIHFSISKKTSEPVLINEVAFNSLYDLADTQLNVMLPSLHNFSLDKTINTGPQKKATQPYWLSNARTEPFMYNVDDQYLIGQAKNEPEYVVMFSLQIDSAYFFTQMPVKYIPANSYTNEAFAGNVSTILPVIVSLAPNNVLTNIKPHSDVTDNPELYLKFKTNFSKDSVLTKIRISQLGIKVTGGKTISLDNSALLFEKDSVFNFSAGEMYSLIIPVKSLRDVYKKDSSVVLGASVSVSVDGITKSYYSFLKTINYNYLPEVSYYYRDITKVIPDEIRIAKGDSIGYIYSEGDWMFFALQQLGYNVKTLTPEDFVADSLRRYSAIIAGMQLENIENYLEDKYDSLINYVTDGGNLIFLDNQNAIHLTKPFNIISVPAHIRAENAETKITVNNTPVFNYPNKITAGDLATWKNNFTDFSFDGFDSTFQAPLLINDVQNKESTNNAFLIKHYGNGHFVFVGLSLASQISSGVASAYKLLANIISLPNKSEEAKTFYKVSQ